MECPALNFNTIGVELLSTEERRAASLENRRTWAVRCPLKKHRLLNQLTLRQVEQAIGLRFTTLSNYEQGIRKCHAEQLGRLAVLYGCKPLLLLREYELWRALTPPSRRQ